VVVTAAALGMGVAQAHATNPTPNALTFGPQGVGTTSPPQTVTLAACPTSDPGCSHSTVTGDFYAGHTFRCPDVLGIFDPGCALSQDYVQTNNCPSTMPPGTSCTMQVSFKPTAAGARLATMNVGSDVFSAPVGAGPTGKVSLTGQGVLTKKKKKCRKGKRGKKGAAAAKKKGCKKRKPK
jgi:hypothetical protein